VKEDKLSEEDQEIAGEHTVSLCDELFEWQIADAALDVFHSAVAIGELDNFEFEVWHKGKQLETNDDHESYALSEMGSM
jgi:hypothetical protein